MREGERERERTMLDGGRAWRSTIIPVPRDRKRGDRLAVILLERGESQLTKRRKENSRIKQNLWKSNSHEEYCKYEREVLSVSDCLLKVES